MSSSGSVANPHFQAWRTRRRNRLRTEGRGAHLLELAGPLVAAVLLTPLLRPVFLQWMVGPPSGWGEGMAGTVLRGALLVIGVLTLDVYGALIRGADRPVLAILPVDPAEVVRAELVAVGTARAWMLPAAAIVLSPVAVAGAPWLWALGLLVIALAWVMGLVVSAWVHLRAVDAAEDPAWASLLDRVRGSNPREQSAFLYAPGVVIGLAGTSAWLSTVGLQAAWAGDFARAALLAAPLPVIALAAATLSTRAASWFAGSLVLAEIDARYAAFEDPEEGRRVYLDWAVRWLPERAAVYALKDLRHGWRARRTWITGAWLLGVAAFAAGWNGTEAGPIRAADAALAAGWLCAAIGVLLELDEPGFLRAWLPEGGADKRLGRLAVLLLWLQPPAWLAAAAVLLRRGVADAGLVLGVGLGSGAVAAVFAMACGALGRRGLAVYAPVGAVAAGLTASWMGG